jgi:hypothetical protein
MARIKKAQKGIKASPDSTGYYDKLTKKYFDKTDSVRNAPYGGRPLKEQSKERSDKEKEYMSKAFKAQDSSLRQSRKNKAGYDKDGFPIKKQKNGGSSPAWQRKEGKNPSGGLNAKGRASYNAANPGKPGLKAPQPEGGSRKKSFCARMSGMKKKLTSSKTANDPNSRINKSLRKWKC